MELLHDAVRGIHLLHWLTVAVPLATLVVVSGAVRPRLTGRLLLLGVAVTLATGLLGSIAPETHQIRYGAPLPMLTAGLDASTGEARTPLTILRACFVADVLFWCSLALLLGAVGQGVSRRLCAARSARFRRRSPWG